MTITFVFALLKMRFVSLDYLKMEWISFSILLIHACRRLIKDISKQENIISSNQIDIEFSLKYDLQQLKSFNLFQNM